ncbi:helix-turn-helix domain-containing protein [Flammeovirga kamogawensis]|uniref:Helix-turn-helix domain-containing protein n=1 Tax=Flammeovirga kamogawensis TaxID=373891 RepID=A0ABX8H1H7_9BACT|nr:helix-turn-helix domain-containing protein [Flammeovirga kamogawensis]MBB6463638.1 hypothetical protein [Flammeovirga kamogawensis]QWG09252.1 helix-turn-helix domain-containing protein [Flammeovirga kamogawensis]TRX64777.1 helix-turn-helix domain-containing protein [Flammeovirga kamogawensis]
MKNLQLYHRKVIQRLIEEKIFSVPEIAEGLEVSPSTIYRELKRNTHPLTKKYNADYAHKLYLARKKLSGGSRKTRPIRPNPIRKNDYELHTERRFLLWYSDRHYKVKFNSSRFKFNPFPKMYAFRLGIKDVTYHDDWELFDLWLEHLKHQKEQRSTSTPKYYWMRALIKNETTFTLWKNPSTAMEQKKCV